jgi:RNA polymerase sigma-70 factor, ECF subfamily
MTTAHHYLVPEFNTGACKMYSDGFNNRAAQGHRPDIPASDIAGGQPIGAENLSGEPSGDEDSLSLDLDIEQKRWRLAGVDPDKFDYFFDKYFDRIFSFAFWKSGDHDLAADIAGEVFLLAWDRRRQFRWQGYSFGAWLFQIARSVIGHHHRQRRVRSEIEYDPDNHEQVDVGTPGDELDRKTDQALVRFCLEQLSADQYEIIVLVHFVGMTTRQASLVTKRPLGTVNSHLYRGKQGLRRCLETHGAANGLSESALRIVRQVAVEDSGLNVVGSAGDCPDTNADKA